MVSKQRSKIPNGETTAFRLFLLLAMLAVGVYWFFGAMMPWQTFLNSDHAVPYEMTVQPWIKQDFYFWHAGRFGSLFVVFWKAIGRHLFGHGAEAFYLGHCLAFFTGLSFWLMAVTRPLARLLLLYLLLPLNIMTGEMFLMPGHLYGMSFLVLGAMTFLLVKARPSPVNTMLMGVTAGLGYWQHEPTGVLCCLMYLGGQLSLADDGPIRRAWTALLQSRYFALGIIPVLIFAEVARSWSSLWAPPTHLTFTDWNNFLISLSQITHHGFKCQNGTIVGRGLFYGSIWLCLGGFMLRGIVSKQASTPAARKLVGMLAGFSCALVLLTLLIAANQWFVANSRVERYFNFLLAPIVFFMVRILDVGLGRVWYRWMIAMFLMVITANIHAGDSEGWIFSAAAKQRHATDYVHAIDRIAQLEAAKCTGFIGANHSDSYIISALTDGRITAQAFDTEMNLLLFARIAAEPVFCMRRDIWDKGFLEKMSKGKVCTEVGADMLRCSH